MVIVSEVDPRCYVAGCPGAAPGYEGGAVLSAGGAGARPGRGLHDLAHLPGPPHRHEGRHKRERERPGRPIPPPPSKPAADVASRVEDGIVRPGRREQEKRLTKRNQVGGGYILSFSASNFSIINLILDFQNVQQILGRALF